MAGSTFQADRPNETTARAGKAAPEPGERVIRDQGGRSMSNNDEYVGRFSEGKEVLGTEDPDEHHVGRFSEGDEVLGEGDPEKQRVGSFADEDLGAAVQRSRVLEAS
jgi:hypothetical protein